MFRLYTNQWFSMVWSFKLQLYSKVRFTKNFYHKTRVKSSALPLSHREREIVCVFNSQWKSRISNDYLCVGIQHTFLSRWLIGFVASFVTRLSFSIVRETTGDFFGFSALLCCCVEYVSPCWQSLSPGWWRCLWEWALCLLAVLGFYLAECLWS